MMNLDKSLRRDSISLCPNFLSFVFCSLPFLVWLHIPIKVLSGTKQNQKFCEGRSGINIPTHSSSQGQLFYYKFIHLQKLFCVFLFFPMASACKLHFLTWLTALQTNILYISYYFYNFSFSLSNDAWKFESLLL